MLLRRGPGAEKILEESGQRYGILFIGARVGRVGRILFYYRRLVVAMIAVALSDAAELG
jgi:hypothetical protein